MDQKSNGMAAKGGENIKGNIGKRWRDDIVEEAGISSLCPRQGRLGGTGGELHPTRDELSF